MTFNLRSGNTIPFKKMGASPVKEKLIGNSSSKTQQAKFGARQGWSLDKNLRMGKGHSTITRNFSRAAQLGKLAVKALNPIAEAKFTYDLFSHGVKNVKEGKAIIPKGHYGKGGEGYQKKDYSNSFNYGDKKKSTKSNDSSKKKSTKSFNYGDKKFNFSKEEE